MWHKLYAVILTAATWAEHLRGKKVLYFCDNMVVVNIQSGVSKDPHLMELVHELFYIAADSGFEWSAKHLTTDSNGIADSLSRLDLDRFRALAPDMEKLMTNPAKLNVLCPRGK